MDAVRSTSVARRITALKSNEREMPGIWHRHARYWHAMKRVERLRLYPSRHQTARLQFMLDVTRELYNALLQQRRDA